MKSLQEVANIIHFSNAWYILIVPLVLAGFDFLTGFIKAWREKDIQSSKLRDGISKKFGEMIIIIISLFLQYSIGMPKEIAVFIAIYIGVTELISIAENLSKIGVPVPKWITERLKNIAEDSKNEQDN